jgi:D-alanyl-D-alanine carboxypeptidase
MAAQRHLSGVVAGLLALALLCGCAGGPSPAVSTPSSPPREVTASTLSKSDVAFIDRTVGRIMASGKLPGVLVSISSPGKTFEAAYGVADTKTGRRLSMDDHFRIGSVTKTFIATVILQLVDEHEVALDAPLSTYVAGVPGGDHITVRQLLEMRSGLPDYLTDQLQHTWQADPESSAWKHTDIVSFLQHAPANFAPGEKFEYSNSNYLLLGMIAENVTHQKAEDLISDRVIRKLGLTQTSVPSLTTSTLPTPFVHGYDYENGADVTDQNTDFGWTAGNMISTVGDLTKWSKALADGELISADLQKQRLTTLPLDPADPTAAGYGLGIIQVGDWIGHGGTLPGYGNNTYYLPQAHATIIVMANALTLDGSSAKNPNELLAAFAQHFYPGSYPNTPSSPPGSD